MPLRDILVSLPSPEISAGILKAAASLARHHAAHLTGLHVYSMEWPIKAAIASSVSPATWRLVLNKAEQVAKTRAVQIQDQFEETLRRENVQGEWRPIQGPLDRVVVQHARYADLIILGQAGRDGVEAELAEEVLFSSGRPVLLLPRSAPENFAARRVLVGWNGRREAARAVGDALPLICAAESVRVLTVFTEENEAASNLLQAEDIARHLARHGATVSVSSLPLSNRQVEEVLLDAASHFRADLLVIGGYGHSRLRQVVLGGVTRSLLRESPIPVLVSH